MSASVFVYTTAWCPYCSSAKALLSKKAIPFTEVDVEGRDELRAWLVKRSGQRTVPQIFVNGRPLGGFSDIQALDRQGKLDPLLAAAPDEPSPSMPT